MGDLIEVFIRLMDSPDDFTGPMNTGNPKEFRIKDLAEQLTDITGSSPKLEYMPRPSDDTIQRQHDISLAKEKFDWAPKIQLTKRL